MYKSGIIIKLEKKVVIVFNEFAEYEKVNRIPGMFEGQLIQYSVSKSNSIYKKLAVFSGAAAVFVFVFAAIFVFSKVSKPQVFAFVDLDVNPSIEFSIDEESKVVAIKSINDDAKDVVQNLDIKGMKINDAVSETIEEIEERGFVSSKRENVVLISASTNSDSDLSMTEFKESSKRLKMTMNSLRNSIMAKKESKYSVKLVSVSYQERQNSLANKMSMGRYLIYSQVVENGRSITPQRAKVVALGELVSYLPKDFGTKDIDFAVPDRIILQNDEKLNKDRDKSDKESIGESNPNKVSASKNDINDPRNKEIRDNDKTTENKYNTKNNTAVSVKDKETRKHNDLEGNKNRDSRYTPLPSGYDEQIDLAGVSPITVYTPIAYNTPMPIHTSENVVNDKEQDSKTFASYAPPVSTPDSSVIKNSNNDQYVSSTNNGNNTVNTNVNAQTNAQVNTPISAPGNTPGNTPVNTAKNNPVNTPSVVIIPGSTPPVNRGPHRRNGVDNGPDQPKEKGPIQEIPTPGVQKPDGPIHEIPKPGVPEPTCHPSGLKWRNGQKAPPNVGETQ